MILRRNGTAHPEFQMPELSNHNPDSDPLARAEWELRPLFGSFIIVIITLAAMWPVLRAPFVWDDDLYLTMNRTLAKPGGLLDIWLKPYSSPSPYPLVFTTYWFEYRLWGLEPSGYRLVNLLLHATNSILLWRILRKLGIGGAWIAGAIFAIHPVHVESVSHAAERKDVLSGLFYFISILFWLQFLELKNRRAYALSFIAFVLAMLAKSVTCVLAPTLLLLLWWRGRREERSRTALLTIPYFILALALGLYTVYWEKHRTGATSDVIQLEFADRVIIAGRAMWFYFWKLAWPANLLTLYPKWIADASSFSQWLYPITVAMAGLAALGLAARNHRGLFMAFAYVVITLGPALGFINFSTMYYSYVMDHYQYLACAGWIALAGAIGSTMIYRVGGRNLATGAAILLLSVLGFLSFQQADTCRSLVTFWEHNVRGNPDSAPPRYDYGVALENEGRLDEALVQFLETLRRNPNDVDSYLHLGGIMKMKGDLAAAERYFDWATRVDPDHGKARRSQGTAYNHIGGIRVEQGKFDEAITIFERALSINPNLIDAKLNIGIAHSRAGRVEDAILIYRSVIQEHPSSEKAPVYLYQALRKAGRPEEARGELDKALQLFPNNILARMALAREAMGVKNMMEARRKLLECLEIDDTHAEANNMLGVIEAMSGNYQAAADYFARSLESDPNNVSTRANYERAMRDLKNESNASQRK